MEEDWNTYCLMSAIIYIEEMSKPTWRIEIKHGKNKEYKCNSFHSIRLKMKSKQIVKKIFDITKDWERKKNLSLTGKTFGKIRKENYSGQYVFFLSPVWINEILAECGTVPNKYSYETAIRRINNLRRYVIKQIDNKKNLFNSFFQNKKLAAGAFIVSMDLECRGIQSGRISICMSEKYKDFLQFMLDIAKKWNWSNNTKLSSVDVSNSIDLGIKASPQWEFRVNMNGLKDIYKTAGPLLDSYKNKCIKFHIKRSKKYINKGYNMRKNNTKQKIYDSVLKSGRTSTSNLQFIAGVGIDVVLDHLHNLEKEGKIIKERDGKRYIWMAVA